MTCDRRSFGAVTVIESRGARLLTAFGGDAKAWRTEKSNFAYARVALGPPSRAEKACD